MGKWWSFCLPKLQEPPSHLSAICRSPAIMKSRISDILQQLHTTEMHDPKRDCCRPVPGRLRAVNSCFCNLYPSWVQIIVKKWIPKLRFCTPRGIATGRDPWGIPSRREGSLCRLREELLGEQIELLRAAGAWQLSKRDYGRSQ